MTLGKEERHAPGSVVRGESLFEPLSNYGNNQEYSIQLVGNTKPKNSFLELFSLFLSVFDEFLLIYFTFSLSIRDYFLNLQSVFYVLIQLMATNMAANRPLEVISERKNGYLSDLERELGERTVRQLEAMGYIENAPSANGDTWKISSRAKHMADLKYKPSNFVERLVDWYYFNVRRIKLSI